MHQTYSCVITFFAFNTDGDRHRLLQTFSPSLLISLLGSSRVKSLGKYVHFVHVGLSSLCPILQAKLTFCALNLLILDQ